MSAKVILPVKMTAVTGGLLIGAYERDNFGDLLFLDQTRHFLVGIETRACGVVDADMTAVGGVDVSAYPPLLRTGRVPFVWVVGGETGGTSVTDAAGMLGPKTSITGSEGAHRLELPSFASPYLPRPSRYAASRSAVSVVNSVGVSGIWSLAGQHRIETLSALHEANFLSVRDLASSRALRKEGISHRVAPDLVHTLVNTAPHVPSKEADMALVQAKARHIERIGVVEFARLLAGSSALKGFRIRLFSAGEAPGHDSTELLSRVAEEFRAQAGGDRIDVSHAKTAAQKAAEIANAGLWIGTSLHGYIISTAYDVPRVGLLLRKVEQYANSWDIPAPAGVSMRELDSAVEETMELSRTRDGRRLAARLAEEAARNILDAREHIERAAPIDRAGNDRRVAARLDRVTDFGTAVERQWRRGGRLVTRVGQQVASLSRVGGIRP